jgi:hypothetical protein
MPDQQQTHVLQKRLDVIIQLMLEMTADPAKTTAAKIHRLIGLGCSQPMTAQILGKELKYITANVAKLKKRNAGKPFPSAAESAA